MSGNEKITKGYVLEHAPEIAENFRKEGAETVDVEAVKAAAAKAERERIKSVFAQSVDGCEEMVAEMAYDGVTTGPEAAVKVLKAVKEKGTKIASDIHQDGKDIAGITAGADNSNVVTVSGGGDAVDPNAPAEERAKAEWDKNAELRSEFDNDFDRYLAFFKADEAGQVKRLRSAGH